MSALTQWVRREFPCLTCGISFETTSGNAKRCRPCARDYKVLAKSKLARRAALRKKQGDAEPRKKREVA